MSGDTQSNVSNLKSNGAIAISKCLLLWILNLFFLFLIGQFIVKAFAAKWERALFGILGTVAALLATIIVLRIEKKSLKDIGLFWQRTSIQRFFKGIIVGVICFAFLLFLLLLITPLHIQQNPASISFVDLLSYWPILPLALMEEIAFRAYPMVRLNQVYGMRITQIIVAIAFALYHVATGWSLFAAFLGPGVWAIVFGLSAQWSGGIAMPTGIHVALNILQPLVGMGAGNYASVWLLDYPKGTTPAQIQRADNMGTILQLSILLFAWLATELYIRKQKKKNSTRR
jgi:uncharacterized protein